METIKGRKKIAWLENADIMGGAELFSLEMIDSISSLYDKPLEIDIFSGGNNGMISAHIAKISKKFPNYITLTQQDIYLPKLKPISFSKIIDFFSSIYHCIKRIKKGNYDIVYANTVRAGIVLGLASIFLRKNTKTVFMAHDYTFPPFLLRWILPRFTQVLACSYSVKDYLIQNGLNSWKAEVVENGIDINKFNLIPSIKAPFFHIGIIARITEWKGQMLVLKAAKWIKKEAKDYPFLFSFYGIESNKKEDIDYKKKLLKYVKDNNLENVKFKGFTPIETALSENSIIIHSATENEPFGRVPIEVAAGERILCLSNKGYPSTIFEDKKNAFFFESGNYESLAHTLIIISHNKDKSLEIAKKGRILVKEKFNLSILSKRFWNFILSSYK
jgi:glycosyltransferase involved in cell wall biosynthesis